MTFLLRTLFACDSCRCFLNLNKPPLSEKETSRILTFHVDILGLQYSPNYHQNKFTRKLPEAYPLVLLSFLVGCQIYCKCLWESLLESPDGFRFSAELFDVCNQSRLTLENRELKELKGENWASFLEKRLIEKSLEWLAGLDVLWSSVRPYSFEVFKNCWSYLLSVVPFERELMCRDSRVNQKNESCTLWWNLVWWSLSVLLHLFLLHGIVKLSTDWGTTNSSNQKY